MIHNSRESRNCGLPNVMLMSSQRNHTKIAREIFNNLCSPKMLTKHLKYSAMDEFPAGHKLKSQSKGFQLSDNVFTRLENSPMDVTVSI